MLRSFNSVNQVSWNPWHGCHPCSSGCSNCFVYEQDKQYGKDASEVIMSTTGYRMPDTSSDSIVKLCFTSDFFLEEADAWRDEVWETIRKRDDCIFLTTTKRPERIVRCLPTWWGMGLDNFVLNVSIENQELADKRVPLLLEAPLKHREVFCSPLIAPITLRSYLSTGDIKCVNVSGELAMWNKVRPLKWEWVAALYQEAKEFGIDFYFHQSGTKFMYKGCNFGASTLKQQKIRAQEVQQKLKELYG